MSERRAAQARRARPRAIAEADNATRRAAPVVRRPTHERAARSAGPKGASASGCGRPTTQPVALRLSCGGRRMKWEVVIGLETHAQLSTASKIFFGRVDGVRRRAESQASAVDIALPGVLPVLNRARSSARSDSASRSAEINLRSVFARKNYFYPDLPKGYQISQFEIPVVVGGAIAIASPARARSASRSRVRTSKRTRGSRLHEDFQRELDWHRPQPRRHAAPRNRLGARDAKLWRGGRVREDAARAGPLDRHMRRQHAGGQLPLRRQRVGAAGRRSDSSARAARSRTSTASASWNTRSNSRSSARSH